MRGAAVLLLSALLLASGAAAQKTSEDRLTRAQELIDAGDIDEASRLLDRLLKKDPRSARGHLLRSTVHFVDGDLQAGRRALDRALELDPSLRRAWLNRGALDLSEQLFDSALEAFERARELAPEAEDNSLNIGTVLLLLSRLPEASSEFQRFLESSGEAADSLYLVASNYAMAGYAALAVEHLRQAIAGDERARLQARTDPNFADLAGNGRFELLMGSDTYQAPPGAHMAGQSFDEPYDRGEGRLLQAVIDAVQLSGRPFDPRVEVTPGWALVWGEMRIKVTAGSGDAGVVLLSAPAGRFTPEGWTRVTQDFYRDVIVRLHALRGLRRR